MNKKSLIAFILIVSCFLAVFGFLILHGSLQVLNPQGLIAIEERNIIFLAFGIMLSVAVPVVLLTFFIAWHYRATNTKAKYAPTWTGNIFLKGLWWAILGTLLIIFCVIVWIAAHRLDPYIPIASTKKPITIEVVALQWKWLFIYPEQHIATVNYVAFPTNTPLNFTLTADAPMTTFWIPSLGSQIYAMSSMETKLHLIANTAGSYPGGTTEINGAGYAGMRFTAVATTQSDFDAWVQSVQKSNHPLTLSVYDKLAKPSEYVPVTYYSTYDSNLYDTIIMKYMPSKNTVHVKP